MAFGRKCYCCGEVYPANDVLFYCKDCLKKLEEAFEIGTGVEEYPHRCDHCISCGRFKGRRIIYTGKTDLFPEHPGDGAPICDKCVRDELKEYRYILPEETEGEKPHMILQDGKIRIRNAEQGDCEQLAKWWNDGAVMAHAGFPHGLGTSPEKVAEQLREGSDISGGLLIVEYEEKPIGEMSYRNLGDETAEIGIKICETVYQERGVGRVTLSLLIKELFGMGFSKIVLDTNLKNTRAQHVYESMGFKKTATRIDSWEDQAGELQSSVDYELTEAEFNDFSAKA